jgi:hypothetical protein
LRIFSGEKSRMKVIEVAGEFGERVKEIVGE